MPCIFIFYFNINFKYLSDKWRIIFTMYVKYKSYKKWDFTHLLRSFAIILVKMYNGNLIAFQYGY